MNGRAYYNEIEPFAAEWLRNLIRAGLIADGEVDTRSIVDVCGDDLRGFTQCHFFAGIGGWSYALRLAGWPDDRPVWTGSCPCQPFSAAGKRQGQADDRHLWPEFYRLIRERSPVAIMGEQVASPDGLTWLDAVLTDLENSDYAAGAVDICSAGFGAPHIRQRLYWMADAVPAGRAERWAFAGGRSPAGISGADVMGQPDRAVAEFAAREWAGSAETEGPGPRGQLDGPGHSGGLAVPMHAERRSLDGDGQDGRDRENGGRQEAHGIAGARGEVRGLADAGSERRRQDSGSAYGDEGENGSSGWNVRKPDCNHFAGGNGSNSWSGPVNGMWRDADWLFCRDERWRPVEAGTFPLAHGLPARVGRLRGYGNAINAEQAAQFIKAVMGEIDG